MPVYRKLSAARRSATSNGHILSVKPPGEQANDDPQTVGDEATSPLPMQPVVSDLGTLNKPSPDPVLRKQPKQQHTTSIMMGTPEKHTGGGLLDT